jgi:hypothetical protein
MPSASTILVQAELRSGDTRTTAWVEPRIKAGDVITLKNSDEPARRWEVVSLGARQAAGSINHGWDNNI